MNLQNKFLTTALFLSFLFAQSFWAQSDWIIEQLSNRPEMDMDVGSDGIVHIVYQERTYSGKGNNRTYEDHVYYNTQTEGVLGIPLELGLSGLVERRPAIDVVGVVAHVVFDMGGLQYWNSEKDPDDLVALDYFPYTRNSYIDADIAVSSSGAVHVVLSCNPISECCGGNIFYTSGDGNGFSPIVNIESLDGIYIDDRLSHRADIEIDDDGNIGIVYRTVFHGDVLNESQAVFYITKPISTGTFSPPIPIAEVEGEMGSATNYSSLILNSGSAYVLYGLYNESYTCSCQGRYDIFLDKFDPADGISEDGYPKVVANASSGASIDYQVLGDKLHLAYVGYYNAGSGKKENWTPEIRYVQLNVDGEQSSVVEGISDGFSPLIVANADGTANISFMNGNLFFATNDAAPPTASGAINVNGIVMSPEVKGARWNAVASVYIENALLQPVSGVLVTGNWTGLVRSTNSATTDDYGFATVKSGKTKNNGTITFTVTDVAKTGWTYDRAANNPNPPIGSISSPLGKRIAEIDESAIPDNYALFNNYPNPFNPSTKIKYSIPEESYVILTVYDVLGKEISSLVDQYQHPGYYEIDFDASNLSNDVYFYVLKAGDFVETKKMILMK